MKHTPGPWKVSQEPDESLGYRIVAVDEDHPALIARRIHKQDAYLMAAAPLMLQTIIDTLRIEENAIEFEYSGTLEFEFRLKELDYLRNVIKKAKGEL